MGLRQDGLRLAKSPLARVRRRSLAEAYAPLRVAQAA